MGFKAVEAVFKQTMGGELRGEEKWRENQDARDGWRAWNVWREFIIPHMIGP